MPFSSPSLDTPVSTAQELAAYFQGCEKSKIEWRISSAHEKFPYHLSTLMAAAYDEPQGLMAMLTGLQDYGWRPVCEHGQITGLTRAHARITLEPGGQVRFNSSPMVTLHELAAEVDQHLHEVDEISAPLELGFLGMGFHPIATSDEIPWAPTGTARVLLASERAQLPVNLDVTRRCCAAHVSLDYADETDMVKKFRAALMLEPVVNALFASSPFVEGKPCGVNSQRAALRAKASPERFGIPYCVFEEGFGYERYVEYALDIPLGWVVHEGREISCGAQTFRDYLDGKLQAMPRQRPTLRDWVAHLERIYTDTRLTGTLDLCGADSGDAEMLLALPSLWTGLLYDDSVRESVWSLVSNWTTEEHLALREDAIQIGLRAEIRGRPLTDTAEILLKHAQTGLRRRTHRLHEGADESRYLGILFNMLEVEQNRSDQLLMHYAHFKDFSMRSVFDVCRLKPPPVEGKDEELTY
ncbi:MAG: glutamate-cysteine ligase family protein [Bdellovibrionales bacterium]